MTPRYTVRPATVGDVEFLADVVLAATRAQGRLQPGMDTVEWRTDYCRWSEGQITEGEDGNTTSVIEVGGERVGRLRVRRTAQMIELAGIQLLPEAQGRGIGTAIIEALKDEASTTNVVLELDVEKDNPDACRLYRRLGFAAVGETRDEYRLRWPT